MPITKLAILGLFVFTAACTSFRPSRSVEAQFRRGDEWLSWHQEQRAAYVYGYTDGYLKGFYNACLLADELFEVGQPHRLGDDYHPTEVPSGRCLAKRVEFSKVKLENPHPDVTAYTAVITEFYEKHTNCRDLPFPLLLDSLSKEYSTANNLYDSAMNGRLRGPWCQ